MGEGLVHTVVVTFGRGCQVGSVANRLLLHLNGGACTGLLVMSVKFNLQGTIRVLSGSLYTHEGVCSDTLTNIVWLEEPYWEAFRVALRHSIICMCTELKHPTQWHQQCRAAAAGVRKVVMLVTCTVEP